MPAKPHTTLLFAGASELLRADFAAPGATPTAVARRPRQAEHGLVDAARHALALGGPCGRNVWVASDDMWSQVIALPLAAAGNLSGNELAAALAFESEPLSGISSSNAAIGHFALAQNPADAPNSGRNFAVIACDLPVRDSLQKLLDASGGNLRGMAALSDLPANKTGEAQEIWLQKCLEKLSSTPPLLPIIQPKAREVSPLRYYLVGAALLAISVTAVWFHSQWINREISTIENETARLREPQQRLAQLRKKIDADRLELKKLEDENTKRAELLYNISTLTTQLRQRVPATLRGIKDDRPGDVAVQGISVEGTGALKLDGLSLNAELADLFVTKLDAALKPYGLNALPYSKEALGIAADGGPWKFSMQVQPIAAKTPDTVAKKPVVNYDGREQ